MEKHAYTYDVALSFAGEDRPYVDEVATILKSFGILVFYDKFEEVNLWGKNLFEYLNEVYKSKAKYTVMFISEHYQKKAWTTHERKSMQERAFLESNEYILPVRFDDTQIPGLYSTISYIDLRQKTPGDLARLICLKIGWVTKNRWWGTWQVASVSASYVAKLIIHQVHAEYFEFVLQVFNGSHSGSIEGKGHFTSSQEAVFQEQAGEEDKMCLLTFFKMNDSIQVNENQDCSYFHGMRAHFMGDYQLQKDVFYAFDFVNDQVLTTLHRFLTGDLWDNFVKCFGDIHVDEDLHQPGMRILYGGVPGLYTIYEAILIVGPADEVWGAFLDVDKLYYFTSENPAIPVIPETIHQWRSRFVEKKITPLTVTE